MVLVSWKLPTEAIKVVIGVLEGLNMAGGNSCGKIMLRVVVGRSDS